MELAEIARGATAVVYDMGDGRALKLFNEGYPREPVEREFVYARIVSEAGIPAAHAHEVVELDGRAGIVYEKLDGGSMLDALLAGGDAAELIGEFARLHQLFHASRAPALPSLKDMWKRAAVRGGQGAYVPLIDALPDGDRICHGDYHPANVLLTKDGLRAIDFMNVCRGDPICDIARTIYLIELTPGAEAPMELRRAIGDAYLDLMSYRRAQIALIMPALMAARVAETQPGVERDMLLEELSKVHFI